MCSRWALNNVCKTFINITICCHFTPRYFLFYIFKYFFFTLLHWTSILFSRRYCMQFWTLLWVVWYFKCESLHFFRKPFFLGAFSFFVDFLVSLNILLCRDFKICLQLKISEAYMISLFKIRSLCCVNVKRFIFLFRLLRSFTKNRIAVSVCKTPWNK